MNRSFFNISTYSISGIIIFIICICTIIIPIYYQYPQAFLEYSNELILNDNSEYIWPIPNYTKITSPFGKRKSPTAGASTYHKGIDVGAPEGTNLYAVCEGKITFVRISRRWGIHNNSFIKQHENNLLPCITKFHGTSGRYSKKRTTHSKSRTQKCIWSYREQLQRPRPEIQPMEQQQDHTYIWE